MAWLDQFLLGIKTLFVGGVQQPAQLGLNLIGAGGVTVTSANNPSLGRSDVTISGGSVPLRLTFAQSGTTIACSNIDQDVFVDQSGGAGTYPLPPTPIDGQRLNFADGAAAGSWGANAPTFTVPSGTKTVQPSNLAGGLSTVSCSPPAINWNSFSLVYGGTEKTWFLG